MASSSLAPSPQTTIMPLQPKRNLCSSTLPPLQLLLSLLLPQTSYTKAHASSLSFSSAPTGIWLGSLPLSPKPWPPPSHPTLGLLLQVLTSGHLPAAFTQWPHTPSGNSCILLSPAHTMLSPPSMWPRGGGHYSGFCNWWSRLLLCPLPDDLLQTLPRSPGCDLMTDDNLHWYFQLPM